MGIQALLADVTIPFDFGLPQVFVLVIGLGGLGLLIWVVLMLTRGKRDKFGVRRRRFLWGRAVSGSLLLLVAVSLLYLAILLQSYLGLTDGILVAHIRAQDYSQAFGTPYMEVDLTLYDAHGKQVSENVYGVCGKQWMLQADILRFQSWVNILGFHSGYKVTRLLGQYNDDRDRDWYHTVIDLNGGHDSFFNTAHNGGILSAIVQAAYGSAVFQNVGDYTVSVSQDALTLTQDNSTAGVSNLPVQGSKPTDCRQLH